MIVVRLYSINYSFAVLALRVAIDCCIWSGQGNLRQHLASVPGRGEEKRAVQILSRVLVRIDGRAVTNR